MTTLKIDRDFADPLLDVWPIARLATVSARGTPHIVPAVFVRARDHLYIPVDGKQKRNTQLQRFKNVAANPDASLLLDHYADDWAQLWWVRIDGKADRFQPQTQLEKALVAKLRAKYPQYRTTPVTDQGQLGGATFLRIAIDTISGWAQSQSPSSISESLKALNRSSESY